MQTHAGKTILSGVKPTGRAHIGNYFGAMRQFVKLQNQYHSASTENKLYFFIADYHALNFIQDGDIMRDHTTDLVISYLSIGLDPEKSTIYKQSSISTHTELAWIFETLTTMAYLKRSHAYKDAENKGQAEVLSAGTFNYPMLMAADILLYDTDIVPVGSDQKQHIEFARDTAEKFNRTYCTEDKPVFKLPDALIFDAVATIPGTDGRKMSKSYSNYIALFAEKDEIAERVMSIVTDSSGQLPQNVFNIHKLFKSEAALREIYDGHRGKYKVLKEMLIDDIDSFTSPFREKRREILSDIDHVERVLESGASVANEVANAKMLAVKKAIGVI